MKKLILSLIMIPFMASATEISDGDIKNKFLTVVKDVEVEDMIGKTTEFNNCRKDNEYKKDDPNKDKKLELATACFKKNLVGKDAKALQKLADDLRLENYGLIKSKNVNDITDYLAKKMRKSLTGIDPDEKDPKKMMEQLKWENRKLVDQKVFIDMYNGQLMKSALFEVSKFCFEHLRKDPSGGDTFASHWDAQPKIKDVKTGLEIPDVSKINDQGSPSFFDENKMKGTDMSKTSEVIGKVVSGLTPGTPIVADDYGVFFGYCQKALPLLCDEFRKTVKTQTEDAKQEAKSVVDTKVTQMSKGANACLTIDRLKAIRTTIKNTEAVVKQFEEMGEDSAIALTNFKSPKFYERGKGANEESIDEITSYSSTDMLANAKEDTDTNLEDECRQGKGSDCDDYLVESDSLDKAIHNVESEMNFKREIEVATIKKIFDKPEELDKYLNDNGHFDLINKLKDGSLKEDQIADELSKIYDARKVAEIETLKLKVGKRQVSEDNKLTDQEKNDMRADNIKDTKLERARLAQVVMFNNIITSQLTLTDKTSGDDVGRNVNGWKKELAGMESTNSYDETLFSGIQQDAVDKGSKVDDASIVGGGIIDNILGKAP